MSKGQDNQDPAGGPNSNGEAKPGIRRRELLRLGAIGVGVGVPVVMTLVPRSARAEGSWQCVPGSQAGAQGSWCQQGGDGKRWTGDNWRQDARDEMGNGYYDARKSSGFVFPGSHEWRLRREEEAIARRRARGDFNRFGSSDGE